jgi:hypothetical protein
LARATITKSWLETSSTAARVFSEIVTDTASASEKAGSSRLPMLASGSVKKGV